MNGAKDLVNINAKIILGVIENVVADSPNAIVILVHQSAGHHD